MMRGLRTQPPSPATGGGPGALRRLARRPVAAVERRWPAARRNRDVLRTTGALMATTAVTSLMGFVFWTLAARLVSEEAVGYGAAGVSAMTLLGTFGMLGLGTLLIGELAREGRGGTLVAASLTVAAGVSAALALAFAAAAVLAGGHAPYATGANVTVFALGAAATAVGLVLDQALIGLLLGGLQLARNAVFAVAKVALLALTADLLHDRHGLGIVTAWMVGTVVSLAVLAGILAVRGISVAHRPDWSLLGSLRTSAASHTWLNVALQTPRLGMPILVTAIVSATAGSAFFAAWMVVWFAYIVPTHLTTVLFALGAAAPAVLREKLAFTLRLSLIAGLVVVPAMIVFADPVLRVFGAGYAERGALPLQLLALAYFPVAVKAHYVAVRRVQGRLGRAARLMSLGAALELGAAAAGAAVGGLVGLSAALLAVSALEAAATGPAVARAARGGARPAAGAASAG